MLTCHAPVFTARTLDEALRLRSAHVDATILAGGTDLMVQLEGGSPAPSEVLDLWGCEGMRGVTRAKDGGLRIGALTTFADLRRSADVPDALRDCAATVGARQIQARATVGGNLANASPAGDSLPLWLALGAEIEVASLRGARRVPASAFHVGYRRVDLDRDELIVAVHVPDPSGAVLGYRKVGTRLAQAISKVVFAGALRLDGDVVVAARLAMGSVAPVPVRLATVEELLVGRPLDPGAADVVGRDIRPIDDVRSNGPYRQRVARNVIRTWLKDLRSALDGEA